MDRLPVELIFLIIEYLDAQEIVALQSTCTRLRGIIVSQLWGQLQLKCTGPKWRSLRSSNDCKSLHQSPSFYHKHTNKRGGYVACDVATNLRQFAKAARLGAFDSVYQWVRVLSLVTALTVPTGMDVDTQIEHLSEEQFDQLDIQTVMAWLISTVLPEKITQLRVLEIMLECGPEHDDHNSNVPIVQRLISRFPDVETHVHIQLDHQWTNNIPSMSFGNIKTLHVQCEGIDDVQRLCGGSGTTLPASIEQFELVDSKEMAASKLKTLLSGCKRLKSLSLKWGHVSNPQSIDWLPASVTQLQMCHFHGGEENYRPVSADGVVYFKSYSRIGSVFNAMRFPNLERLAVQGPVDDESHLTRAVAASFATSPHIKQLKCRRLRPSFVTTILESTRHSLESLIVLPGGMATHVPAADCLKLATRLQGIETLVINISSLSQHNVIRFLRDALTGAPSLKTIYIEHIFMKKEPWMRPLDSSYVYDGHSRVRVESRWTYLVDTALFASMHLLDLLSPLPLKLQQQIAVMN